MNLINEIKKSKEIKINAKVNVKKIKKNNYRNESENFKILNK